MGPPDGGRRPSPGGCARPSTARWAGATGDRSGRVEGPRKAWRDRASHEEFRRRVAVRRDPEVRSVMPGILGGPAARTSLCETLGSGGGLRRSLSWDRAVNHVPVLGCCAPGGSPGSQGRRRRPVPSASVGRRSPDPAAGSTTGLPARSVPGPVGAGRETSGPYLLNSGFRLLSTLQDLPRRRSPIHFR
jgi:hypothetical protein